MPKRRLLWQLFPSYLVMTLLAIGLADWWAIREFDEFVREAPWKELVARAQFLRDELEAAPAQAGPSAAANRTPPLGSAVPPPGPAAPLDASSSVGSGSPASAGPGADSLSPVGSSRSADGRDTLKLPEFLMAEGARWSRVAGVRWSVIARDGRVLWDSERKAADIEDQSDRPEFRQALAGHSGRGTRREPAGDRSVAVVAVPMRRGGEVVGVAEASMPLAGVDRSLSRLQYRALWAFLATAAIATLVSVFVARRVSRPLEEMRQAAERFARGELYYKLRPAESREFGGLADALNVMAAQLQERIDTIVRQNNEQRAVLSSMVEGVLAIDNQERIISLNNAASLLLGIDPISAQGRSLQEVVRNTDLRRFITRALASSEPIDDDVVLHGDYEGVLQARGAALHDGAKRAIGAVIVLNDVTDFRRLEHIRRDFVANVSHELKTPVTSIKGFVETLLDGAMRDPLDTERFLTIVAKQADRLNAIIDDLLSLSKIEQGEEASDIELSPGSIRDVIDSAVAFCQGKAAERRITIQAACDESVVANINSQLLEQALINLLDNAIKYSEPGGEVQTLGSQSDNEVTITVSDRGVGIATKHLSRVFERFYRVDKARSRKLGGTGLGLAIVKHIVQANGGRVSVKSVLGSGSTFTIHLPRPNKKNVPEAAEAGA